VDDVEWKVSVVSSSSDGFWLSSLNGYDQNKKKDRGRRFEPAIKKTGSFSLIACVILSAGAMLIFSVSFQIDQMPEGIRF
jgi:hypothetical protein